MILRSIIFYFFLAIWTIIMGIICLPYLFVHYSNLRKPTNIWILGIFKLLKYCCNISYKVEGKENIPNYPIIVASKHQSAFETFALYLTIKNSIFIHKKELYFIPIFGQYLKKSNMISIERSNRFSSMKKIIKQAKLKMSKGYSIIIFPEGTRKKIGELPSYKSGFIGIYNETEREILPVALNSGYCWPKHTFIKKSGKIIIKILKPIPAKLNRKKLLNELENVIEEETNKLLN
ncbi:MAG: hypothetical protein CFH18_00449 [Alphaproteobacteria bacterium MarineAlpha5_Bin8]|nr:MAG: hypothetical protein CFH17_00815 [Alphaproteobacteria bacterium MarineAlpha5_Bin7]PPR47182.1 MAG: hypothetical protein CFH18_00449 [Alphaproteobacteria bacterium MarineAlpha5_Bin8]PPR53598.1 MAG: hypothetical protein CFH16_00918 [Alphaproteobacteria bacterium MarineAlpha5_Bin6]|tara:strand:+ start:4476 stop:5177 length:702 start_codon:yes stop_codon:yes gene_type:complete